MENNEKQHSAHECLFIDAPAKYGVVVENNMNSSIFSSVYDSAKVNVRSIIYANKTKTVHSTEEIGEECINTTIAFVGGRGTGKSSAMTSFAKWLNDKGKKNLFEDRSIDCDFVSIPTIDTNQLGTNETILGRISAALMNKYEQEKPRLTTEERRAFIKQAKYVNELSVKYSSGEWFKVCDTLLDDTVGISKMRFEVQELVKSFLKIMKNDSSNNYLVVPIDDIDMGVKNSFAIMEEIRKFLCVTNIVVLVSLDSRQLEMVLKANYAATLGKSNLDENDMRNVNNLSYRYIEKLFPYSRQHHMPELTLEKLRNTASGNFLVDKAENEKIYGDKNWPVFGVKLISPENTPSVFDALMHLIWRKTLLILVCNAQNDYLLIPRNLRSLCNMVVFLRNLPDVVEFNSSAENPGKIMVTTVSDRKTLERNLDEFRCYILDNIEMHESGAMDDDDQHMANTLMNIINEFSNMSLTTMNSKIVADILHDISQSDEKNIYRKVFFDPKHDDDSTEYLLDATVYPDSISVGDVMYVIGKVDSKTKCRYINYLIEVIRVIWSIMMTAEYSKHYIYGTDKEDQVDFRRAIGGLIVNPDKTKLCPLSDEKDNCSGVGQWFVYIPDGENNYKTVVNLAKTNGEDSAFSEIALAMTVCKNIDNNTSDWRRRRWPGKPYYEYQSTDRSIQGCTDKLLHPLAVITHCLYANDMKKRSLDYTPSPLIADIMSNEEMIMPIPVYSLSFVSRWYDALREYVPSASPNNYIECFKLLFNIGELLSKQSVISGINDYIPPFYIDKILVSPMKAIHDSFCKRQSKSIYDTNDLITDLMLIQREVLISTEYSDLTKRMRNMLYKWLTTSPKKDIMYFVRFNKSKDIKSNKQLRKYINEWIEQLKNDNK